MKIEIIYNNGTKGYIDLEEATILNVRGSVFYNKKIEIDVSEAKHVTIVLDSGG